MSEVSYFRGATPGGTRETAAVYQLILTPSDQLSLEELETIAVGCNDPVEHKIAPTDLVQSIRGNRERGPYATDKAQPAKSVD